MGTQNAEVSPYIPLETTSESALQLGSAPIENPSDRIAGWTAAGSQLD